VRRGWSRLDVHYVVGGLVGAAVVFKWLEAAINCRKADIAHRKEVGGSAESCSAYRAQKHRR
jgi:hypothetical protein